MNIQLKSTTIKGGQRRPLLYDIATLPGDKSISHRSIILGSLSENTSEFENFLTAEDCLNTLSIFQQMGVSIRRVGTHVSVEGVGIRGLKAPQKVLDTGNSGTGIRLITGVLAGQTFDTRITGDASIQRRPMKRIIDPLKQMGAKIEGQSLPGKTDIYPELYIEGQPSLQAIHYMLPVASAQVKSAILLASLFAKGTTVIEEPEKCRDHTERFLSGYGADFSLSGTTLRCSGDKPLRNPSKAPIYIPSDISSAAFFVVLGLLFPDTEIRIRRVGINPTRDAVLVALKQMGASITLENQGGDVFEPYADLVVRSSSLKNVTVASHLVPFLIDEIPILAVAAMFGSGTFKVSDAKELRVKESDRIKAIVEMVQAFGGTIREFEDGIEIDGGFTPKSVSVKSYGDHRIAMSTLIGALAAGVDAEVDDTSCINTSFPNFMTILRELGLQI